MDWKLIQAKIHGCLYSKTCWFNFFSAVVMAAQSFSGQHILDEKVLLTIITLGNVALRFMTNQGLQDK